MTHPSQNTRPKPVVLAILDGWGHREELDSNAIAAAKTPAWDALLANYPHGLINASELHVGLPTGQMGNSEVGHMNIGSGRVLMQELPKIDAALADGSLAKKPAFVEFVSALSRWERDGASRGEGSSIQQEKSPHPNPLPGGEGIPVVHVMGLLSDGGVHSHQAHIIAMCKLLSAAGLKVCVHVFTDGRDTPPQSAQGYLGELEGEIVNFPNVKIATVSGRFYAMDRDNRWDRVQKAYDAMVSAVGARFELAEEAIEASYTAGKNDEFVAPSIIGDYAGMKDGDGVFMVNFRSDRVREMLTAMLDPEFKEFTPAQKNTFSAALGMTEYSSKLAPFIPALFPPEPLTNILGEVVANAGLKQLRIAETEKYAHVTFFFNGGREALFAGEERILVPSPKVATYDLQPEMSAPEVTDKLVAAIEADTFDLIVVNYANTDMVGHTGNVPAAIKAVEAVDFCLGRVLEAVQKKGPKSKSKNKNCNGNSKTCKNASFHRRKWCKNMRRSCRRLKKNS
ncbi:MAG: 2,3-bisphosphoglycerate-independent phosphoglycerate mutase [Alphaproteobacteria bacterium]|nr:2,3-bisphosphoglycerate-independent phosphoglycerate mutase [Alphaproteobacteria bacterium]